LIVVAGPAVDAVYGAVADDLIVERRAEHVLDPAHRVLAVGARHLASREVHLTPLVLSQLGVSVAKLAMSVPSPPV
jgi:hypothetical protein